MPVIEQALQEILADRSPVGGESAHLAHLAQAMGVKDWHQTGVGHLQVGAQSPRWWVAVGIDEPTLLLTGEGTDQSWGFASYGMPKDATLLRQRELRHQSGQLVTIVGPESADASALKLCPGQPQAPAGATWAVWPNSCALHGNRVVGPGAGGRLLAAATMAALATGNGSVGAIFVRMSRFSAKCLTDLLLSPAVSGVIWLGAMAGTDADLGHGAYHLRAPALPGDLALDRRLGGLAARFVDKDALPPFALEIRRAGRVEFGLGLVVTHGGEAQETACLSDGEALAQQLVEIAAMG